MDFGTAVLVGLVVGMICGLIPLATGYFKGRLQLGVIGFVASAVGGIILGLLLALPIAVVFTLAIVLMRRDTRMRTTTA